MWREHLAGRRDSGYPLWTLLMFEAWRRRWSGIRAVSHAAPDTQAGMAAVSPLG
jgi:hypothetical protein